MLKNEAARKQFLEDYQSWGIWLTVPKLGMRAYRKDLPDGAYIVVTEYLNGPEDYGLKYYGNLWSHPRYHVVRPGHGFSEIEQSIAGLVTYLKDLKEDGKE